ncbi:MAG: hypothetical protein ACP5RP_01190 [Candidatus Micrarchaeia archaeon]
MAKRKVNAEAYEKGYIYMAKKSIVAIISVIIIFALLIGVFFYAKGRSSLQPYHLSSTTISSSLTSPNQNTRLNSSYTANVPSIYVNETLSSLSFEGYLLKSSLQYQSLPYINASYSINETTYYKTSAVNLSLNSTSSSNFTLLKNGTYFLLIHNIPNFKLFAKSANQSQSTISIAKSYTLFYNNHTYEYDPSGLNPSTYMCINGSNPFNTPVLYMLFSIFNPYSIPIPQSDIKVSLTSIEHTSIDTINCTMINGTLSNNVSGSIAINGYIAVCISKRYGLPIYAQEYIAATGIRNNMIYKNQSINLSDVYEKITLKENRLSESLVGPIQNAVPMPISNCR